jgi:hypothetical protein
MSSWQRWKTASHSMCAVYRPTGLPTHDDSEEETRDEFIDLLIAETGWPLSDKRDREYEVHLRRRH